MDNWQGDIVKLLLAVAVGGVIGLEREVRDKPAGFRTMILIAVGAALFTIFSIEIAAGKVADPARIAAQIVTGVGFLGAGAILRDRRHVIGLTTAAAIWLVASLGIGAGMGAFRTTIAASLLVLVVLLVFSKLEAWVDQRRDERSYEIVIGCANDADRLRQIAESLALRVNRTRLGKQRDALHLRFRAVGAREAHKSLIARLVDDPAVVEFMQD